MRRCCFHSTPHSRGERGRGTHPHPLRFALPSGPNSTNPRLWSLLDDGRDEDDGFLWLHGFQCTCVCACRHVSHQCPSSRAVARCSFVLIGHRDVVPRRFMTAVLGTAPLSANAQQRSAVCKQTTKQTETNTQTLPMALVKGLRRHAVPQEVTAAGHGMW